MKKSLLLFILSIATFFSKAQNKYPWPSIGNVGIGTTSPSNFGAFVLRNAVTLNGKNISASFSDNINSTLDIRHPQPTVADISSQGSSLTFSTAPNGTDGIERLRISKEGNIGLGNIPALADPLAHTFQIGGKMILQNVVGNQASLTNNAYYDGTGWFTKATGPASGLRMYDGGIYIYTVESTNVGTNISNTWTSIGKSDPQNKLDVAGSLHAQAIKVDMTGWSDYVFKTNYNLLALKKVEAYINKNHHLLDMPSEREVVNKGVDLGAIVKLQQKKIEELTLYLIEKDKQLAIQNPRLKKIESNLKKL